MEPWCCSGEFLVRVLLRAGFRLESWGSVLEAPKPSPKTSHFKVGLKTRLQLSLSSYIPSHQGKVQGKALGN